MYGNVRLYDYRCFAREFPATLPVRRGFASFIGPNNAGKSALIRCLYELRQPISALGNAPVDAINVLNAVNGFNIPPPLTDPSEVVAERPDPQCAVELLVDHNFADEALMVSRARIEFAADGSRYLNKLFLPSGEELSTVESARQVTGQDGISRILLRNGENVDFGPMLAFVRNLQSVQYFGAFRNAINEGGGTHYDLQIGTGFIAQWLQWKTGATKSQNRAIQKVTEDVRRLIGVRTLEISASMELKTLQVVVDGRPYKLAELGSGIAQLILVLGNALIRKPSFVAIDEPETNLHPALQQDFLTTLASYSESGVLFATHSVGLARSAADHCFSIQRRDGRSIVRAFEKTPHYAEFLGSLGIAGLQELGWDCILLVEGTTDVRTFRHLLRLYGKDRRTVILPLGGDSMVNGNVGQELAEVLRLGNRVFAVVDSERDSHAGAPIKARTDFAALCASLGIACCVTDRRATENYWSERAIAETVGSRFSALGPYEKPGNMFWGKSENWRVAQAMSKDDLDATDVGAFLAKI